MKRKIIICFLYILHKVLKFFGKYDLTKPPKTLQWHENFFPRYEHQIRLFRHDICFWYYPIIEENMLENYDVVRPKPPKETKGSTRLLDVSNELFFVIQDYECWQYSYWSFNITGKYVNYAFRQKYYPYYNGNPKNS